MRLSEKEFARLTKKQSVPKKRKDLAKPKSAHQWERQGGRYVCLCCNMGIPLRFWPEWQNGFFVQTA